MAEPTTMAPMVTMTSWSAKTIRYECNTTATITQCDNCCHNSIEFSTLSTHKTTKCVQQQPPYNGLPSFLTFSAFGDFLKTKLQNCKLCYNVCCLISSKSFVITSTAICLFAIQSVCEFVCMRELEICLLWYFVFTSTILLNTCFVAVHIFLFIQHSFFLSLSLSFVNDLCSRKPWTQVHKVLQIYTYIIYNLYFCSKGKQGNRFPITKNKYGGHCTMGCIQIRFLEY